MSSLPSQHVKPQSSKDVRNNIPDMQSPAMSSDCNNFKSEDISPQINSDVQSDCFEVLAAKELRDHA